MVDSPEAAAAYTAHINQQHEITTRLRDIPHLYSRTTADGSAIKIHVPTGPYGAGGVQVVALPAEIGTGEPLPVDKDGRILTRTIFDFSEEVQHEYARQILLAMEAEEQAISAIREKNDFKIVFTENTIATVSTLEHRTSRTIAVPHTQAFAVLDNTTPFAEDELPITLSQESRLIRMLSDRISRGLLELYQQLEFPIELVEKMGVRQASPFGYVIETKIKKNWAIEAQAQGLAEILAKQRQLYAQAANELVEALANSGKYQHLVARLIPQPSYRTYGTFNQQENLELSFSPVIISRAGVMEAMHRPIDRSPHNPNIFWNWSC